MAVKRIDIEVRAHDTASGVFARVSQQFAGIKATLGGRGGLKETFELIKGGGALAGLTFGGRAIEEMATKAGDLRAEWEAGKKTTGEMTEEILASVPVYGQIWQAGRAIREVFTQEKHELEAVRKEAERISAMVDFSRLFTQQGEQAAERMNVLIGGIAEKLRLVNLEGFDLQFEQAAVSAENLAKRIREATETEIKKLTNSAQVEIDKIIQETRARTANRPEVRGKVSAFESSDTYDKNLKAQQEFDEKTAQLEQQRARLEKQRDDAIASIRASGNQAAMRAEELAAAERQRIADSAAGKAEDFERQHRERMAQLRTDAAADALDAEGRQHEARLIQMNLAFDRQIDEARQRFESLKTEGVTFELLVSGQSNMNAEIAALEQARAAAARKLQSEEQQRQRQEAERAQREEDQRQDSHRDARVDAERMIADLTIESLELEASLGDRNAKIEAERLRIAAEYAQKRREIAEAINREGITDQQRADLQRAQSRLDVDERNALAKTGSPTGPTRVELKLPEAIEGRFLSGLSQAAKERAAMDPVVNEQRRGNQHLANIQRDAAATAKAIVELPAKLLSGGGFSVWSKA